MERATDNQETSTITFEWVLRGLKSLFDTSKGESKSKVTKSVRFGGGKWQILFYANSGTENGAYVSLYLSCEPTPEEKEKAIDGKWVREGVFKFTFELRSLGKAMMFNIKEAHNHHFSSKTANWGWAQFARRDQVYYNSHAVKEADALLIVCTITSSPQPPEPPHHAPMQLVPKNFLERVGALLDDPLYSDVEFILPNKGKSKKPRKIYANRKILERADYFQSMFGSGFAEASTDDGVLQSQIDLNAAFDYMSSRQYDDSDDEEDNLPTDESSLEGAIETENISGTATPTRAESSTAEAVADPDAPPEDVTSGEGERNVKRKLSHPSSPRSATIPLTEHSPGILSENITVPGPKKMRVVIKDVAYVTYKAVLYYIYTDVIVFAPLLSSFTASTSQQQRLTPVPTHGTSESQSSLVDNQRYIHVENPTTRREWIMRWQQNHPAQPSPCSAKAVYRLADKLGLLELKERAYQHIQKSLSVENIPYEVFSPFSATFADIRKVQVNYFLEHWADVRASEGMRGVWQQIRNGRHPGFEEVWPVIAQHLEFNPHSGVSSEPEN